MKASAIPILCFLLSCAANLQAGVLTGRVSDNQGRPIPYATLYVPATGLHTTTNDSGNYTIPVPDGNAEVSVLAFGFPASAFAFNSSGEQPVRHDFRLSPLTLDAAGADANRIVKAAIANRRSHHKASEPFKGRIYVKGVLRTQSVPNKLLGFMIDKKSMGLDSQGRGIVYLSEEFAMIYMEISLYYYYGKFVL